MKTKLHKTNHLYLRAWERGINQFEIDRIIEKVKVCDLPKKGKALIIVSNSYLRKIGIKVNNKTNYIMVAKCKVLKTIFPIEDLYSYLKRVNIPNKIII